MNILKIKPCFTLLTAIFIALVSLKCSDLLVWNGDPGPEVNMLTERDSTAVRALLDANGLQDVEVREVISLQSSRVGGITLDSLAITSFVFTNALNTFVHGFSVNIIDCPVETLIINN